MNRNTSESPNIKTAMNSPKQIIARGWHAAITSAFGPIPPLSMSWNAPKDMVSALNPILMDRTSYNLLPWGGGEPVFGVSVSKENGCINIQRGKNSSNVVAVLCLSFEYIPQSPENSFFLLETRSLTPFKIYEDIVPDYEDVVEMVPFSGKYFNILPYEGLGIFGYDSNKNEIPIPDNLQYVTRHLKPGKFMIVYDKSLWNYRETRHDRIHNTMEPAQIRATIEDLIRQLRARQATKN